MGKYSQEEGFRMKIWMENKAKIEKHNRHYYKVRKYQLCHMIGSLVFPRDVTPTTSP